MYTCSKCGASMSKPLDRCPSCHVLLSGVKCQGCGYVGGKTEFVNNNDRCPKCGSVVRSGGSAVGVVKFCPRCGEKWNEYICDNCGHKNWVRITLFMVCGVLFTSLIFVNIEGLNLAARGACFVLPGPVLLAYGIYCAVRKPKQRI